jgi:hypothetical protein
MSISRSAESCANSSKKHSWPPGGRMTFRLSCTPCTAAGSSRNTTTASIRVMKWKNGRNMNMIIE